MIATFAALHGGAPPLLLLILLALVDLALIVVCLVSLVRSPVAAVRYWVSSASPDGGRPAGRGHHRARQQAEAHGNSGQHG